MFLSSSGGRDLLPKIDPEFILGGSGLEDPLDTNKEVPVNEDSKELSEEEKKPLHSLELTLRDLSLLQWVHEHRYLTFNQMQLAFWQNASAESRAYHKRVERLVNSGYLERQRSGKKSLYVFLNTEKALKVLVERDLDSEIKLYKFSRSFESYIDHDLKVTNLRILFRELGLRKWTSERILHERDHILNNRPDGVLTIKGKKIAIEFENYLTKTKIRYRITLDYYSSGQDYHMVFMIIDGRDAKDWLLEMPYDARRVWFASYKDLFKNKGEAVFRNLRGEFKLLRLLPKSE